MTMQNIECPKIYVLPPFGYPTRLTIEKGCAGNVLKIKHATMMTMLNQQGHKVCHDMIDP